MAPDMARASGGLRVIHAMAAALCDAGFDAAVWHGEKAEPPEGLESDAPVIRANSRVLAPGDVLVMTELGGGKWSFLVGDLPVVMLVQGPDFVFCDAGFGDSVPGGYPGWPSAAAAVTVSSALEGLLGDITPADFPVHRVPVGIDTDLFRPREKRRSVALMPRRRAGELKTVVHILRRRGLLDEWDLTLIDGMDTAGVARALGEAAIFLSGAQREGFGLPGAEAMAAGAAVVGFTGHAAREFMDGGRARAIPESDLIAMADAVEDAMREFENDRPAFDSKAAAARDFIVNNYGLELSQRRWIEVFGGLQAPGSAAVIQKRAEIKHYSAYRGPSTAAGRAVLAARTRAGSVKRHLLGRIS